MAALHLRGTVLPEGRTRDLWLLGDRITFARPAGESVTVAVLRHPRRIVLRGRVVR